MRCPTSRRGPRVNVQFPTALNLCCAFLHSSFGLDLLYLPIYLLQHKTPFWNKIARNITITRTKFSGQQISCKKCMVKMHTKHNLKNRLSALPPNLQYPQTPLSMASSFPFLKSVIHSFKFGNLSVSVVTA